MGERGAEVGADDAEPAFGPVESESRRTCSVPAFAVEFTGELNNLLGPLGKPRMRLKCIEAVRPNPPLPFS